MRAATTFIAKWGSTNLSALSHTRYFIERFPFAVTSLLLATSVAFCRWPFSPDFWAIAKLILASLYFQIIPSILSHQAKKLRNWQWVTIGPANILAFFVFMLLGFFRPPLAGATLLAGSMVLFYRLKPFSISETHSSRKADAVVILGFGLVSAGTAAMIFCLYYLRSYASVFYTDVINSARAGLQISRDTTANIAYATMFDVYHRGTSGLRGLQPFKYQLGVHVFYGAVAAICKIPVSFAAAYSPVIVGIPAFFNAMFRFAVELSKPKTSQQYLAIASLLLAGMAGLIPLSWMQQYAMWPDSYYVSDTNYFGHWLLFIFCACLVPSVFPSGPEAHSSLVAKLFATIVVPIFMGFICYSKVSVGITAAVGMGVFMVLRAIQHPRFAPYLCAANSLIACLFVSWINRMEKNAPFAEDFFRTTYQHPNDGPVNFYFFFYYPLWLMASISVLGLAHYLLSGQLKGVAKPSGAIWNLIYLSLYSATVAAGGTYALHFDIAGGSGWYIASEGFLLPMFGAVVILMNLLNSAQSRAIRWAVSFALIVIVGLGVPNISAYGREFVGSLMGTYKNKDQLRDDFYEQESSLFAKYLAAMRKISQVTDKRTMVYLDPDEPFWRQFREKGAHCQKMPLFIVTQTQRPSLLGVDLYHGECGSDESEEWGAWLGKDYPIYPLGNLPRELLCKEVHRDGFQAYVCKCLANRIS